MYKKVSNKALILTQLNNNIPFNDYVEYNINNMCENSLPAFSPLDEKEINDVMYTFWSESNVEMKQSNDDSINNPFALDEFISDYNQGVNKDIQR